MTDEVFKKIKQIAHKNNIEYGIYENYSGRFMFGQTTNAMTISNPDHKVILQHEYNKNNRDKITLVIDNMGYDYIIY